MFIDSVAHDVKIISDSSQLILFASCLRALFIAPFAYHPNWCVELPAFPKCSVKNGIISFSTSLSTGVVAA